MEFFKINQKKKTMTTLAMQHSKMVVGVKEALEALEVLVEQIFQIYLKIFLGTLVVGVEEVLEKTIIEAPI